MLIHSLWFRCLWRRYGRNLTFFLLTGSLICSHWLVRYWGLITLAPLGRTLRRLNLEIPSMSRRTWQSSWHLITCATSRDFTWRGIVRNPRRDWNKMWFKRRTSPWSPAYKAKVQAQIWTRGLHNGSVLSVYTISSSGCCARLSLIMNATITRSTS